MKFNASLDRRRRALATDLDIIQQRIKNTVDEFPMTTSKTRDLLEDCSRAITMLKSQRDKLQAINIGQFGDNASKDEEIAYLRKHNQLLSDSIQEVLYGRRLDGGARDNCGIDKRKPTASQGSDVYRWQHILMKAIGHETPERSDDTWWDIEGREAEVYRSKGIAKAYPVAPNPDKEVE